MNATLFLPRPRLLDELVGFSKANLLRMKWHAAPMPNRTLDETLPRHPACAEASIGCTEATGCACVGRALRGSDLTDCLR